MDDTTSTSYNFRLWNTGDTRGLNSLIERHLPWICNHLRKRMGPLLRKKGETNDFVQDAMVQFLKYAPRIHLSDDSHFRALMVRIVENSLRDKHDWFTAHRRNICREQPLPSDTVLSLDPRQGANTPSKSAVRHEEEAWVRLGMELLDEEYRRLLVMRKWENLSFTEIGERLEISETAARLRHNRAVRRLGSIICDLRYGKLDRILKDKQTEEDYDPGG